MYKVISTFSGIGGSSLGYKMAGMNVLAAIEFLDYQAKNYILNNPLTRVYQEDIRKLNPLEILKDCNLKVGELDVLDGSPPCSSFSTAGNIDKSWGKSKKYGNRKQRTDDLFFEYIRFINSMQPKIFVCENVSGLIKGNSKGMFNIFLNEMKEAGYNVKAKLLNAANYGVPQIRQRIIFIGVRNDLETEPVFPKPNKKVVTLIEAFKNVVNSDDDLKEVDVKKYSIYEKLLKMPIYGKCDNPFSLLKESPYKPSRTLTATNGSRGAASVCHWDNRKFTVNECKAISSFPEDWKTIGSTYAEKVEGFGRAVPPLMMKAIAETIKNEILDKLNKEEKGYKLECL